MTLEKDNEKSKLPAPTLSGKLVFPARALLMGLKGHEVTAVYAAYSDDFKKKSAHEGWESCEFVGISTNLDVSLQALLNDHGSRKVAHLRVQSMVDPKYEEMDNLAMQWRALAEESGGTAALANVDGDWITPGMTAEGEALRRKEVEAYLFDDDYDDDEDDDDDDWSSPMDLTASQPIGSETLQQIGTETSDVVQSPFSSPPESMKDHSTSTNVDLESTLELSAENVDKVLEEVRPFLISDGGNVSVERVDEDSKDVYLNLEGACSSCESSTVTMKLGIEKVLREKFVDLGEIIAITDTQENLELTLEAVEGEIRRLSPAITAMGGVIEVVDVDPAGVVKIRFRGSTKIMRGLELALLGVPMLKHVEFVM